MLTFLDLLIIVSMLLIAASLLSLVLMFLLKNKTAKRVCLYLVAVLSVYLGYVGCVINWPGFFSQVVVGAAVSMAGVAAVILDLCSKKNEKLPRIARILAAVAVVIGIANAFLI